MHSFFESRESREKPAREHCVPALYSSRLAVQNDKGWAGGWTRRMRKNERKEENIICISKVQSMRSILVVIMLFLDLFFGNTMVSEYLRW